MSATLVYTVFSLVAVILTLLSQTKHKYLCLLLTSSFIVKTLLGDSVSSIVDQRCGDTYCFSYMYFLSHIFVDLAYIYVLSSIFITKQSRLMCFIFFYSILVGSIFFLCSWFDYSGIYNVYAYSVIFIYTYMIFVMIRLGKLRTIFDGFLAVVVGLTGISCCSGGPKPDKKSD